jgi:hypothetical protein
VLPIEALIAKDVFPKKVKFWNTASEMLKLDDLRASVGGGRIGPGGGHKERAVGMRKDIATMVGAIILETIQKGRGWAKGERSGAVYQFLKGS